MWINFSSKQLYLATTIVAIGGLVWYKYHLNEEDSVSYDEKIVPEDAPEECPGLGTEQAGKADACAGCPNRSICASGAAETSEAAAPDPALEEVRQSLSDIKNVVLILSGKGGVGKSTVASQLSWALASQGKSVALLDIDICGPSIPTMFKVQNAEVHQSGEGWDPVYINDKLSLMSIGFLLSDQDDAVIWRGPKKNGLIRQFLTSVRWGAQDYLIVDTPPGTSDEHLSLVTYLKEVGVQGVILVTTPQEVSLADVRKEATFCEKVSLPVIGVVENMTNSVFDNFGKDGEHVSSWAASKEYPLLAKVPLDVTIRAGCDSGVSDNEAPKEFVELASLLNTSLNC